MDHGALKVRALFSLFLMWKRLSGGQKCFLRPYFPLNREVVLDVRFGHWKWPNREWGKGHFHLLKWLCPHCRFRHPKSQCQKHISMIHLLNTEKGVPSEYPGSHITERNIKTGNQCKSGQKSWDREGKPLQILIAVQTEFCQIVFHPPQVNVRFLGNFCLPQFSQF